LPAIELALADNGAEEVDDDIARMRARSGFFFEGTNFLPKWSPYEDQEGMVDDYFTTKAYMYLPLTTSVTHFQRVPLAP
jgi:hypothetical protein